MAGHEAATGRLGKAAEWYAGQDWRVFPCWGIADGRCACGASHPAPKDIGKHPHGKLVPQGMTEATADTDTVRGWWEQEPEANVGVSCAASGLIVVDIDPRNGGLDSWPRIVELVEKEGGSIPETVEACTGEYTVRGAVHKGRHLYFRVQPGEALRGGVDGMRGVDVKHKGYVLVAPSRHGSGVVYEWVPGNAPWEREIAEAPEELLGLLRKRARSAEGSGSGGSGGGGLGLGVLEWDGKRVDVDALLEAGIYEGERATQLYRIACAVANKFPVDTEMGKAAVRSLMRGINQRHVNPPLDWDEELAAQVENAIEFVCTNPRSRGLEEALGFKAGEMVSAGRALSEDRTSHVELKDATPGQLEAEARVATQTLAAMGSLLDTTRSGVSAAETATGGAGGNSGIGDVDATSADEGGRPGARTLTELGNGRRVIDRIGAGVRYTDELGWVVWNGQFWRVDPKGLLVREIVKRLPIWIAEEIADYEEGDPRREELLKWAHKAKSYGMRKVAMDDAMTDLRIQAATSTWDSRPELLAVKNGVINLRTGELLPFSPDLHITKQSLVSYTPGHRSIQWTEFLDFATGGDKELQRFLQMAAGYTLTGYRNFEILFLIYGPAGSGKSTFLDVLSALLGDYSVTMDSDVLVEKNNVSSSVEYYMASLIGKRMVSISEWPDAKATKEEAVKRLTGDLMMPARNPAGRPFEFQSQAKLWIGTNSKPRIADAAMWRRIRAVNFNHVPEKPNPDLKAYLTDPERGLPAVLSWAVDGAAMVLSGADMNPLRVTASRHVQEATEDYRRSEDRITMFLDEETRESAGASVAIRDLYGTYRDWCDIRGEKPMTMIAFMRRLEEKGLALLGSGTRALLSGRQLMPRAVSPRGDEGWGTLVESATFGR